MSKACPTCKTTLTPNTLDSGAWCLRCNHQWPASKVDAIGEDAPRMTAATVKFFQRDDVRSFVAAVRSIAPDAKFAENDDGVAYFCSKRTSSCLICCPGDALAHIAQGRGEVVISLTYEQALREGRALIEDATTEQSPAPATQPAADTVTTPLTRCACSQEIRIVGMTKCGDCRAEEKKKIVRQDLDRRIVAASVDPVGQWRAWANPGSEWP